VTTAPLPKLIIIICAIVVAVTTIHLISTKNERYYWWYPAALTPYPDNREEAAVVVRDYIAKRTPADVEFALRVDEAPEKAFQSVISESEFPASEMRRIMQHPLVVLRIKAYKALYNRARPHQALPDRINVASGTLLPLKTADTPSYPAGHAYQGYLLASVLSRRFPHKKHAIDQAAERLAESRIYAGVHYPSDNAFSKALVNNNNYNNNNNNNN